MPKGFSINCTTRDGTTSRARGELQDSDVEMLSEFLEHVERLRQAKLVRDGFAANLHVATRQGEPLRVDAKLPDRTAYAEFIHELRPFVLENEDWYFPKIAGILGRACTDERFRQLLRAASDRFTGRTIREVVQVSIGQREITGDAFLRDWLNAYEYHREREKRDIIEALHTGVPSEITESMVLMLLIDKTNAVSYLGRVVELCLGVASSAVDDG